MTPLAYESEEHRDRTAPRNDGAARSAAFDRLYRRKRPAYGASPSPELAAALSRMQTDRKWGLDLGAGAGRNTLAMARSGMRVVAVDQSPEGVARMVTDAEGEHLAERVEARCENVCDLTWTDRRYDMIVAATLLDHLTPGNFVRVWRGMLESLSDTGLLFTEVHTVEDPGAAKQHEEAIAAPPSESAEHVIRYFHPNELLRIASPDLRILRYEERLEWDRTHGEPHGHAKATLLATRYRGGLCFYGCPDRASRAPGSASADGEPER